MKLNITSLVVSAVVAAGVAIVTPVHAQRRTVITVDAASHRHPISPLIYGVCFGRKDDVAQLNFTINRQGGNNFTRYNWKANTVNIDSDWYFESIPGFFLNQPTSLVPGQRADSFIKDTKTAGAEPMITIPMIGWVAKVTSHTGRLYSYSVAKYGPQQKTDPETPDAGNGKKPDGTPITGNDPNDANLPAGVAFQREWVQHLVKRWGGAAKNGVRYYIMDNEPGLWQSTHQDVHPKGYTSDEYLKEFLDYAGMVKSVDPKARVVGPEEWGWPGFSFSGADWMYMGAHNYQAHPDKDAHGGMDFMPWLLDKVHKHDVKTGKRLLDVFTFHWYPQGGEEHGPGTGAMAQKRNRSTRTLWDPNYKEDNWINANVALIPRLRRLVDTYYPGTKIGLTEYNWGAEQTMNGATAQADILGIFGREGLDLATRWTAPPASSPTFKAIQMYRNYDGKKSTFGDVSVSDSVPNTDNVSSFAAIRSSDKALTVIVINKQVTGPEPVTIALNHAGKANKAQIWQLTTPGSTIARLADTRISGGHVQAMLPAQSVTLFVVPR